MSYNQQNYYFTLYAMGKFNDLSHISDSRTLILPICTQTINLVEEHAGNLDLLADRLRIDPKSRNMSIFAFKLDKSNVQ